MKNVDFQINLLKFINNIGLDVTARLDYFNEHEDIVVNPVNGGQVVEVYMDGTKEIHLPFEIACKSLSNEKANNIIWSISTALNPFDLEIPSQNNSYQFISLEVGKPAINGRDEQGFFIYTLNITAKLEI